MELREYWRIFVRRWWLALLPALVVVLYTLTTYTEPATVYQAHANFAVGLEPEQKQDYTYDGYYNWLTSEYIANGLSDIVRRERFAAAVSQRLADNGVLMPDGAPIPSGAIQGAIASDNAQSLFVVFVTWGDPETAVAIIDAITLELIENAKGYFPQLSNLSGPPARRIDNPMPAAMPTSLRQQLTGPVVRITLGLIVGLALVALLHYLDPTVREREELEAMGYVVLAQIPRRSKWPFQR
jgi:capsular polysaccharide biosynthesis protein